MRPGASAITISTSTKRGGKAYWSEGEGEPPSAGLGHRDVRYGQKDPIKRAKKRPCKVVNSIFVTLSHFRPVKVKQPRRLGNASGPWSGGKRVEGDEAARPPTATGGRQQRRRRSLARSLGRIPFPLSPSVDTLRRQEKREARKEGRKAAGLETDERGGGKEKIDELLVVSLEWGTHAEKKSRLPRVSGAKCTSASGQRAAS